MPAQARQKGFTLIEAVLSLAVLALTSVFILQFFVSADRLNDRASALDQANVLCITALEHFKGAGSVQGMQQADPYRHAQQTRSGAETMLTLFYDADFVPCDASSQVYELQLHFVPLARQGTGGETCMLTQLTATVYMQYPPQLGLQPAEQQLTLCALRSSKYTVEVGGEGT